METGKSKNIDEINNIVEMVQTMLALDIPCEGLQTLEEMKHRVKNHLHQSAKKPSWTAGKAFSILSKAKDEDARKRDGLLNLFVDTEKILNKMDEKILNLLQQKVGNVEEKMSNHKLQLARREYFLLVAGETGSGKSSLVNLILGEELLPYSVLSTTSTICELKFGKERKLVAHFKDKDPETGRQTKVIPLREPTDPTKQSYIQQISHYVHVKSEREKGSVYKKIELYWPHSLLEKGVVIIDSPGVGESDMMDDIVTQYLPQAFAFIYVINSANAGGVQKDRLEKLLDEVRGLSLEGQGELPSKCALFVCNKWDQVPEGEVKEVKNHVIRNLQRCWPGLDPEAQIIYMSTMKAKKGQTLGIITEDFSSLMNGMKTMVLKSIEARLEIHWRWLDYLLSRIVYQAKAFVKNASRDREKVLLKITAILARLVVIETRQSKVIEELNKYLEDRVDGAMRKIADYLSSEEVKVRFTSWTLDEVPKVESSWKVTANEIKKVLSRRLREIIEQWEEDNQVFTSARESLVRHFQQQYQYVEEQLQNLQTAVTSDHFNVPQNVPLDNKLTLGDKIFIGVTGLIFLPFYLVAFIVSVPLLGPLLYDVAKTEKMEDRRKIRKYEADKCAYMAKLSAEYLDEAKNEVFLETFVKEQLEDAKLCLKQIEARIPELIQADKMLCEQLIDETRSQEEIEGTYQPITNEGSTLRGQLTVFGFTEVCANEISSEELEWKEDASHRLGCGAFASVYKGTMRKRGADQRMPVALKVCNNALDETNASETMTEVQLLRKLKHPNIVEFYGTSLLKNMGKIRVIFVMEKCKENLKSRIFETPECIPGKSGNPSVVKEVCRWAIQITGALAYIHKQGIVHRDLKLENILVSEDGYVKVTDVGVSKPAVDITGTIAGTPVYIAPEVFHSAVYDSKADIYSLGLILWEMWYGQQAYADITAKSLHAFFKIVDKGHRPEHVWNRKQPPDRWVQLMRQCWAKNPEERPTAKKCYQEITELTAEVAIGH